MQKEKETKLLGLTFTLITLLPTLKPVRDVFALTLNPLFTVKAV